MYLTKKIAFSLGLIVLTISGLFLWKANAASGLTNRDDFNLQVLHSLVELNLPKSNDQTVIDAAPDNLSNYINYRSGISLSKANKEALRLAEQKSWDQAKRIGQPQLAQILTDVAFEKLGSLSDTDINNMAETLCGFNDQALPENFKRGKRMVKLRANGEGWLDPKDFISQLSSARDAQFAFNQLGSGSSMPFLLRVERSAVYNRMVNEISNRVKYLTLADPGFLGGSESDGLTPSKALLVTYSFVSDDLLAGNATELQQKMLEKQEVITRYSKGRYPGPQSHHAYGVNGYIYSSPLNYLLDDASTARIFGSHQ